MSIFPISNSAEAIKWTEEGQVFSGVLVAPPTQRQLTDYGTNNPRLDKNGNPMMGIVLTLRGDDGVEKTVYADSKSMQYEFGSAVQKSGAGSEQVGGRFTIKYLGKQQVKWSAMPAHMYDITYEPPAEGATPPQSFPAAAQQPPAQPAAQSPAPAVQAPPVAAQQPPAGDPWGAGQQQPPAATTNPWA